MNAIRAIAALVIAFGCSALVSPARAHEASTGDDARLAAIARQFPCPSPTPSYWSATDRSLGTPPRCSLVVATLAAPRSTRERHVRRTMRSVDLKQVRCVHAASTAFRDAKTNRVDESHWIVELHSERQPTVGAVVDRRSGKIEAKLFPKEFGASLDQRCTPSAADTVLKLPVDK